MGSELVLKLIFHKNLAGWAWTGSGEGQELGSCKYENEQFRASGVVAMRLMASSRVK
jgi:hypothetical protein